VAETIIIMMPPCQNTSSNVKHDGSGKHKGKGPGEAAICPFSLKHFAWYLFYIETQVSVPPKVRKTLSPDPHWPVFT
jgi:hypothetical protein